MSALEVKQIRSRMMKADQSCQTPLCNRAGRYRVSILSYPGWLACTACSKEQQKIWDKALAE